MYEKLIEKAQTTQLDKQIYQYTCEIEYINGALEHANNAEYRSSLIQKLTKQLKDIKGPARRNPEEYGFYGELSDYERENNYELGLIYLKGRARDIVQSFKYMKAAASQGHKEAQFLLGLMYIHGQGTPQNEAKGFWYLNHVFKYESDSLPTEIARMGALMELVKCYYYGIGTVQDRAKAEELDQLLYRIYGTPTKIRDFYRFVSIDRFSEYEILEF